MCLKRLAVGGCRRQYIRCAPDRKLEAIPREEREREEEGGRRLIILVVLLQRSTEGAAAAAVSAVAKKRNMQKNPCAVTVE